MRDQHGQTAAEYLGVLVVVAATVGALATGDVGGTLSRHVKAAVCEIGGGNDCATASSPAQAAPAAKGQDPDAPVAGPPIGEGRDLAVLPWPGSFTVTCSATNSSKRACSGASTPVSYGVKAKDSFSRSAPKFDRTGCQTVTFSGRTSFEVVGGVDGERGSVGGGATVFEGEAVSYDVTVRPDRAEAIEAGSDELPNPLDPTTLQQGEGITLGEEYYEGAGLQAEYRNIEASFTDEEGRRISTGVTRTGPDTVRVFAGDEDYVKQATSLGTDVGPASVSIDGAERYAEGDLRSIDIDVSTAEGWQTYQDFVRSGELPQEGDPGTDAPSTAETTTYSDSTSFSGELGPFKGSFQGGSSDGARSVTTNADGSTDVVANARINGVGVAVQQHYDPDGERSGDASYTLMLAGVDESLVRTFQERNGVDPGGEEGVVRLDFSEDDLDRLSDQAVLQIQDAYRGNGDVPSAAEIREAVRDGRPVENEDGLQMGFPPLLSALAGAQSPEDALVALTYASVGGGANATLNELDQFTQATQDALGDESDDDFAVDRDARFPGVLGQPDCSS